MARLQNSGLRLPPAELKLVEIQPRLSHKSGVTTRPDAIVDVNCRGREQRYVIEVKSRSTPQVLYAAMAQARQFAIVADLLPMVVLPYLSDEALASLEQAGVSGIDLSENGIILAPEFTVWRSGQPNRYPEVHSIRNLYRGASSLFIRCLLLRAEFTSLKELREYALARATWSGTLTLGGIKLSMGTASKVVKQLEEDLLIQRDSHVVRITNAERLLEGLRFNHRPSEGRPLLGKTSLSTEEIWKRLSERRISEEITSVKGRYMATGIGSAAKYRFLSGPDKLSLYVDDIESTADLIEMNETHIFPNIELVEEKNDAVYFDARRNGNEVWASPIQCWLELVTDGPRERDAAQTLKAILAQSRGEDL